MDKQEIEQLKDQILSYLMAMPSHETEKLKGLMDKLAEQMIETQKDGNDVLFCGSDGQTIIKAVHYPRSVLQEDVTFAIPQDSREPSRTDDPFVGELSWSRAPDPSFS